MARLHAVVRASGGGVIMPRVNESKDLTTCNGCICLPQCEEISRLVSLRRETGFKCVFKCPVQVVR